MQIKHLVTDDKGELSIARLGVWLTIFLAVATISIDVALVLAGVTLSIPNAAYALESTMFMAFVSWVAGPRMASYLAPQIGGVAQGVASAVRDARLPSKHDDERGR